MSILVRTSITSLNGFIATELAEQELRRRRKQSEPVPHISLWKSHHARIKTHAIGFVASCAVSCFFIILLFLFLGSSWNPPENYSNVKVAVVDLDAGFVAATLSAITRLPLTNNNFTYVYRNASSPSLRSAEAVLDAVQKQKDGLHAALIIHPGTSSELLNASSASTAALPIDFVFDEGALGQVLASTVRTGALRIVMVYAKARVSGALALQAKAGVIPLTERIVNPIVLREVNLHRPQYPGLSSAVGLCIIMFWTTSLIGANLVMRLPLPLREKKVRGDHILILQMIYIAAISLLIALWPPTVMVGLGADLSSRTFWRAWMFLWLSIMVYMSSAFAILSGLGEEGGNLAHLLYMMLNYITSGLQPTELAPDFYKIGLGLPMYQTSQGLKHIIFGSFSEETFGRNIGILFGWLGLLLFIGLFQTRRLARRINEYEAKIREGRAKTTQEGEEYELDDVECPSKYSGGAEDADQLGGVQVVSVKPLPAADASTGPESDNPQRPNASDPNVNDRGS